MLPSTASETYRPFRNLKEPTHDSALRFLADVATRLCTFFDLSLLNKTHFMTDYQLRNWLGWHHHLASAMLYHLEERIWHKETVQLLRLTGIIALLAHFFPRRAVTEDELIRKIEKCQGKWHTAMKSAVKKTASKAR